MFLPTADRLLPAVVSARSLTVRCRKLSDGVEVQLLPNGDDWRKMKGKLRNDD